MMMIEETGIDVAHSNFTTFFFCMLCCILLWAQHLAYDHHLSACTPLLTLAYMLLHVRFLCWLLNYLHSWGPLGSPLTVAILNPDLI